MENPAANLQSPAAHDSGADSSKLSLLCSGSDDQNEDDANSSSNYDENPSGMQFDPAKGIQQPYPTDILCGRGRSTQSSDHPANRRFRELVNQHKEAYQKAGRREEKTRITYQLVDMLRSEGRFVLFDPKTQMWYEVSEDYAREKVSHSLRSRPNNQRRCKPKIRKKAVRKQKQSPALDEVVHRILQDQQSILRTMMQKETNRVTAEAIMRATLGHDQS
mmetsp:Transcript_11066/g.17757  ORF Transcript_11066/g.17757 Transcript_11066/m.17757 type:complete len:219 (+) Transcript_11066:80-736(+)